jgi:hypothetical protein
MSDPDSQARMSESATPSTEAVVQPDASGTTNQEARTGSLALASGVIAITPPVVVAIVLAVQNWAFSEPLAAVELFLLWASPVPVLIFAFLAIQDGSAWIGMTQPRRDGRPSARPGYAAAVTGIVLGVAALVGLGVAAALVFVWMATA